MTNQNTEANAPVSQEEEAKALLAAEGHTFEDDNKEIPEDEATSSKHTPDEAKADEEDAKEEEKPEAKPDEDKSDEPDEDEDDGSKDSEDDSDDGEDDDSDDKPNLKRIPKYIPAWKAKASQSKLIQERDELLKQLELTKGQGDKNDEETNDGLKEEIQKIGDKHNSDPEFINDVLALVGKTTKPPKDLVERLDKIESEKEDLKQEAYFNQEFEKDVVPELRKSNPDISESALLKIKNKLHTLAFTEEYASLALKKVYRIESDSIKAITPNMKKKTEIDTKTARTRIEKQSNTDNLTDDDLDKMTPEQIEEFSNKQRGSQWNR